MPRADEGRTLVGTLLAVVLVLAALAAIAVLVMRPTRLTGVSRGALETSFDREVRSTEESSCEEGRDGRWACVTSDAGGGDHAYQVTVNDWGCWNSRHEAALGRHEGCITIRDYIGIE